MILNSLSQNAVDIFWQRCGAAEFSYDLFPQLIELAFPIKIVRLPTLSLHNIEIWLARRGGNYTFNCQSRAVRGCLVAYSGKGILFIDSQDEQQQQIFTIAHEVGHFLLDYWIPRQDAIAKMGSEIEGVLDGHRDPTHGERLKALFNKISVGIHINLMERGTLSNSDIWEIEDNADRVALGLLAPPDLLQPAIDALVGSYEERLVTLSSILSEQYSLPNIIAQGYAVSLLSHFGHGNSWVERMGLR